MTRDGKIAIFFTGHHLIWHFGDDILTAIEHFCEYILTAFKGGVLMMTFGQRKQNWCDQKMVLI